MVKLAMSIFIKSNTSKISLKQLVAQIFAVFQNDNKCHCRHLVSYISLNEEEKTAGDHTSVFFLASLGQCHADTLAHAKTQRPTEMQRVGRGAIRESDVRF